MRALVLGEVDEFGSLPHAADVVRIHLAVEQPHAGNLHGVDDGVDLGFIAAFGEIRNALDERGHGWKLQGYQRPRKGVPSTRYRVPSVERVTWSSLLGCST